MIDLMDNGEMSFSVSPEGIFYNSSGIRQVLYDASFYGEDGERITGQNMKECDGCGMWCGIVDSGQYHDQSERYNCDPVLDSLYGYFKDEFKAVERTVLEQFSASLPEAKLNTDGFECPELTLEVAARGLPYISGDVILGDEYPVSAEDFEPDYSLCGDYEFSGKGCCYTVYDAKKLTIKLWAEKLRYANKKFSLFGSIRIYSGYDGTALSYRGDLLNYMSSDATACCGGDYSDCEDVKGFIKTYSEDLNRLLDAYKAGYSKYVPTDAFDDFVMPGGQWKPTFTLSLVLPNEEDGKNPELKDFRFRGITDDEMVEVIPWDLDNEFFES